MSLRAEYYNHGTSLLRGAEKWKKSRSWELGRRDAPRDQSYQCGGQKRNISEIWILGSRQSFPRDWFACRRGMKRGPLYHPAPNRPPNVIALHSAVLFSGSISKTSVQSQCKRS